MHEKSAFSPHALASVATVLIAACFLAPTICHAADADYAAWQTHRDAVKASPDLLRYYTFETVSAENSTVPSLGRESAPLEYISDEPAVVVPGRWPGKRAVRLDRAFFQAKPFDVTDSAFTVEMSFRKLGQGEHLGNGRTNGALFALGDGYWTGTRVWTDYPARRMHFEIGRPKPSSSFGLSSGDSAPDGVWSHLAVTWDGRQMRIYLNGVLLEAAEYSGDFSPTTGAFRVGYANAGIGSIRMEVDEVAVFARALPPSEIMRHAYCMTSLRPDLESLLTSATEAVADDNWTLAVQRFSQLVDLADVSLPVVTGASSSSAGAGSPSHGVNSAVRSAARLGLAGALRRQNRSLQAVRQYVALFDDEQTPEAIRSTALRHCIPVDQGAVRAAASRGVYERLVELPDLSDTQRIAIRRALAECCLREGDAAAARSEYRAVLQSADLPASTAWGIRLQMGHAYLSEKDYPRARAEYAALAEVEDVPGEIRGMALLAVGHVMTQERAYRAAAASFEATAARDELLPYHRQEARGRAREVRRRAMGLPAVDPMASRVKLPKRPEPGVTFFVSPDGADNAPGTLQRPFAGLAQARNAIRRIKAAGKLPAGGATVFVRAGTYAVSQTFELTEADSGTPNAPIIYQAFPGERPIFSGGVTLKGFTRVSDPTVLARIAEPARPHIVQFNLTDQGITDLGQVTARGYGRAGYPTSPWVDLYVNGRPMQLARWPNDGFVKTGPVDLGVFRTDQANRPGRFQFDDPRPTGWQTADDIWMFGYWGHLWAGRFVRIDRIDAEKQTVTTAGPASYGFRAGMPYYYFNVLEELDQPGEWYLDRKAGILYLYPPRSYARQSVEGEDKAKDAHALASVATVSLPVLDGPLLMARDVSHVTFSGLTFELGRTEGAVILGGEHNLLAGCTLRRLGGNGVIVQGGSNHGVLGCDIHTLGAGGVRMSGGDRKTLTPGGHFVENCHIHDFTRVDRVYAPAVHLDGVGNRLAHNLFHESPHHGMRVEGYEHVIEFNEIHSVVYESDDQAGIDMFGNPAYRGNVIRNNFWHHIGSGHDVAGQSGIRLDDQISGVQVTGNVFYRSAGGKFGGVQIHGGKDNIVENNLFIDCKQAVSFSAWGEKRWLERLHDVRTRATLARDGVSAVDSPHLARYPDLAHLDDNADRNFIRGNLAVQCGPFAVRDRGVNEMLDNHSFSTDPGFVDPAARDFTLPLDSPVYDRFPFRPIPFDQIGLYDDERRASWPVEHEVTPHYFAE